MKNSQSSFMVNKLKNFELFLLLTKCPHLQLYKLYYVLKKTVETNKAFIKIEVSKVYTLKFPFNQRMRVSTKFHFENRTFH